MFTNNLELVNCVLYLSSLLKVSKIKYILYNRTSESKGKLIKIVFIHDLNYCCPCSAVIKTSKEIISRYCVPSTKIDTLFI